MKHTKKLMALLLAVLLIASTFSFALAADPADIAGYTTVDYGKCGQNVNWYYAQNGAGERSIFIKGTGAMDNYSPSNQPQWVKLRENIETVVIKEGVTSVGDYAFAECTKLKEVTLEKGVQTIGASAFAKSGMLSTVKFSEQLTSIGESAFEKCYSLKTMDLPAGLKTIGRYAFFECRNLSSEVVIPKGVSVVSDFAFFRCYSIPSLVLKEGVTSIGNSAFSWCFGLKKVELPKSLLSMNNGAFAECSGLTSIKIPEKVSVIPASAFACTYYDESAKNYLDIPSGFDSKNRSSLSEVTMYKTVSIVKDSAFFGCPISKVIFYGTSGDWERVWVEDNNDSLKGAERVFFTWTTDTKPAGTPCKYCGETHGDSFGQKITAFFHKVLAFFGLKKK